MNINVIKTELELIIPKELMINNEYWYRVSDSFESGLPLIPHSFLVALSKKYGYDINILTTQEMVSHALKISRKLYETLMWDKIENRIKQAANTYMEEKNKIINPLPILPIICNNVDLSYPVHSRHPLIGGNALQYSEPNWRRRDFNTWTPPSTINGNWTPKTYSSPSVKSIPKVKDREELCSEIPLADFD